jgi:4-hydroxybenzoyl-CoA thioesterase
MSFLATRRFTIGWGDCAPSGAVFYANYFRWFDQAIWDFFTTAELPLQELEHRYGNVGLPVVSVETSFLRPCRLHDTVVMETSITDWPPKRIRFRHRLLQDNAELVVANETRFWGVRHPDHPRRLASVDVPAEVRDHFERRATVVGPTPE